MNKKIPFLCWSSRFLFTISILWAGHSFEKSILQHARRLVRKDSVIKAWRTTKESQEQLSRK